VKARLVVDDLEPLRDDLDERQGLEARERLVPVGALSLSDLGGRRAGFAVELRRKGKGASRDPRGSPRRARPCRVSVRESRAMKKLVSFALLFPVSVTLSASAVADTKPRPSAAPGAAPAPAPDPAALPRSTPEAQGIPSAAILALVDAFEKKIDAVHSLMVVRHGQVVAEGWWTPYQRSDNHVLYSLSKSFTSTAVGLAIAEGRLTLDDSVVAAFPEDAPASPSDKLKAMRLRDLLSMSTGQHGEDVDPFPYASEESLPRLFLAKPVAHKPGTHFWYNTAATYMASAMVQKAAGQSVLEYLKPRLFEPLGIANPVWDADRRGVTLGGFGLRVRTEDIARFGQLYLQKGQWKGRSLLPAAWVAQATARQVSNGSDPKSDWEQGYGYQFWRCRHGVYRGDGAFGQFCVVMPEADAVVAITSGTKDLGGVLDLVWEHLLPAIQPGTLPADAAGQEALARRMGALSLKPQEGSATSPLARKVAGRRYAFPANDEKAEWAALEIAKDGEVTLATRLDGRDVRVPMGAGRWGCEVLMPMGGRDERACGNGAWIAPDTYRAQVCLRETPFVVRATLRFDGDRVTFEREANVGFGETKRPTLVGTAVAAKK
jgi:CubicO group peptidase (beta-lactamase class C family)